MAPARMNIGDRSFWLVALLGGFILSSVGCTSTFPGGLTEAEWYELPPDKRAELQLQQDRVEAARLANLERELDRAERRREYDEITNSPPVEPSIKLSPEDTAAINQLVEEHHTPR